MQMQCIVLLMRCTSDIYITTMTMDMHGWPAMSARRLTTVSTVLENASPGLMPGALQKKTPKMKNTQRCLVLLSLSPAPPAALQQRSSSRCAPLRSPSAISNCSDSTALFAVDVSSSRCCRTDKLPTRTQHEDVPWLQDDVLVVVRPSAIAWCPMAGGSC